MSVQQHPFLLYAAKALLEKADRSRSAENVRLKLTVANAPELFSAADAEVLRLYELLLRELSETGWVRLVLKKAREFQNFLDREPTLELLDFSSLAQWAGYQSRHEAWDRRLVAHLRTSAADFGDAGAALADYLARSPMSALEPLGLDGAVQALVRLRGACQSGDEVPVRQLSAQIFQARSKVLDNRSELLRVLGASQAQFTEAPIQLLASVPACVNEVIFIENLLTFETMASRPGLPESEAMLLYAAGFRGGAKRLLEAGGAVVYTREDSTPAATDAVRRFLRDAQAIPVYFYGDLDFSGMEILRSLRQVFPQATAWRPGYELLLGELGKGGGHRPEWSDKEGQVDPGTTGCHFADTVLLPAMREAQRFVDQEVVDWRQRPI